MKIVTHSGSFHPDDVFAVAVLQLIYPEAVVVRTRDEKEIESADIVVDVGRVYDPARLRFDHHQSEGGGVRSNGIPYASFGLVWKRFGPELCGGDEEAALLIDERLVMQSDAPDNGISIYTQVFEDVRPYTIGDFMYSYFTNGNHDEVYLFDVFMANVVIAKDLLRREIIKAKERVQGMRKVRDIVAQSADKRVIVLEDELPWEPVLVKEPEAIYVIYRRSEGNWGLKGVPQTIKGFERKKLLPESWASLSNEELQNVSGVADAIFCHKGRFLCVSKTKEGALKLAKIALEA